MTVQHAPHCNISEKLSDVCSCGVDGSPTYDTLYRESYVLELLAEIERLRGMAMDLSLVPEPWLFSQISRIGADLECCLVLPAGSFLFEADEERYGTGPTPAAALNAAIERTK